MWIRSQDKLNLVDSSRIVVYPKPNEYEIQEQSVNGYHVILGCYSTKGKTIKVLDMIEKAIVHEKKQAFFGPTLINDSEPHDEIGIFQMPKDNEVE